MEYSSRCDESITVGKFGRKKKQKVYLDVPNG